jgi:hypothetical protein
VIGILYEGHFWSFCRCSRKRFSEVWAYDLKSVRLRGQVEGWKLHTDGVAFAEAELHTVGLPLVDWVIVKDLNVHEPGI